MSYITKWRKRKAEVDKLLVMDVSDSENEVVKNSVFCETL